MITMPDAERKPRRVESTKGQLVEKKKRNLKLKEIPVRVES